MLIRPSCLALFLTVAPTHSASSVEDLTELHAEIKRLEKICTPDNESRDCDDLEMTKQAVLEQMLKEFGGDLVMSDLYRISGLEDRIGELEIDWRDLPELSHVLREPDLQEKLQAKTGRNEFYVKDFEAQGWSTALRVLPLTQAHFMALNLTSEQIEELIAKARVARQPPLQPKKK
jgi:hypothetical protein